MSMVKKLLAAMGKKKQKQLKRQQHDEVTLASSSGSTSNSEPLRSKKKQKKATTVKEAGEIEEEIETLSFDDAFSAGLAFEQLESYEGAVASFQRAVKCQPTHLQALLHLADVYAAAEQPDEALKYYIKASELEDGQTDASIWFRLGLTYAALKQHSKSIEAYEKSMTINADALETAHEIDDELWKAYGITVLALAEALGELGDLDSVVKMFKEAVTRFPDAANLHYNLATMRMARSKSTGEDAFDVLVVESLERAIELSPETPEFVEELATYFEQHNQQLDRVDKLKKKAEELKSVENEKNIECKQEKKRNENNLEDEDSSESDKEDD